VITTADDSFDVRVDVDTVSNFVSVDQTAAYNNVTGTTPTTDTIGSLTPNTLYYVRVIVSDLANGA
jgi:hypothetical protein